MKKWTLEIELKKYAVDADVNMIVNEVELSQECAVKIGLGKVRWKIE